MFSQTKEEQRAAKLEQSFVSGIRGCVDSIMKRKAVAYRSSKAQQLFYYTSLQMQENNVIQCQWFFKISQNALQIKVAYSTVRTLGFIARVSDQRSITEVLQLLKLINPQIQKELTFVLAKQRIIFIKTVQQFEVFSQKSAKRIFQLIHMVQLQMNRYYAFLMPFLFQTLIKAEISHKKLQLRQQIKQKISIFQNFRKNRIKSSQINQYKNNNITFQKELNKLLALTGANYFQLKNKFNYFFNEQQEGDKEEQKNAINFIGHNNDQLQEKLKKNTKCIYTGIRIFKDSQQQVAYKKKLNAQGSHSLITLESTKFCFAISINQENQLMTSQKCCQQKKLIKFNNLNETGRKTVLGKTLIQSILAKKIPKNNQISKNSFRNQVSFLTFVRHERCIYLSRYHTDLNQKNQVLLMPFYKNSLYDFIQEQKKDHLKIDFYKRLQIFQKIVKGIHFLSKRWVIHRDLKPANIMMSDDLQAKLIDFGSCSPSSGNASFQIAQKRLLGTPGYYFPYDQCDQSVKQKYSNLEYDEHIYFDSYSLGRILNDLFFQKNDLQINYNNVDPIVSDALVFIKQRCLDQNPDDRLSASQLLTILSLLLQLKHEKNALVSSAHSQKENGGSN